MTLQVYDDAPQKHILRPYNGTFLSFEGIKIATHKSKEVDGDNVATLYQAIDGRYFHVLTVTPDDPDCRTSHMITFAQGFEEISDFLDSDDPILQILLDPESSIAVADRDLKMHS